MLLAILGTGVSKGLEPKLVVESDYSSFLVPGVMVMTLVFSSTFSSASLYYDRDWGILKVLLATPHSGRVILLGKSLGSIVTGSLQALAVLAIAAAVPALDLEWQYGVPQGIALAAASVLLLAVFLSGAAQAVASTIRTMQGFHLVMNLVLFPLLFFSGAFFPLDDLPAWLKVLAAVNPMSYAVDLLRIAVYEDGSAYFGPITDVLVLGVVAPIVYWWGVGRPQPYRL